MLAHERLELDLAEIDANLSQSGTRVANQPGRARGEKERTREVGHIPVSLNPNSGPPTIVVRMVNAASTTANGCRVACAVNFAKRKNGELAQGT
jgi:hypothetical protein